MEVPGLSLQAHFHWSRLPSSLIKKPVDQVFESKMEKTIFKLPLHQEPAFISAKIYNQGTANEELIQAPFSIT
jgi:hypothetical protein